MIKSVIFSRKKKDCYSYTSRNFIRKLGRGRKLVSSIQREERLKGKRLMKSRGVTNPRAQVGGGAPTLSCMRAPKRQDRCITVGNATQALGTGMTDKRGQKRPEPYFVTLT